MVVWRRQRYLRNALRAPPAAAELRGSEGGSEGSNEGSGEDQAVGGGGWALRGDGGRATCGVSGAAAAPSDFVVAG